MRAPTIRSLLVSILCVACGAQASSTAETGAERAEPWAAPANEAPATEPGPEPTVATATPVQARASTATTTSTVELAIDASHAVAFDTIAPARGRPRRIASAARGLEFSDDSRTVYFMAPDTRPTVARSIGGDVPRARFAALLDQRAAARPTTDAPPDPVAAAPVSAEEAARTDLARRSSPIPMPPSVAASHVATEASRYLTYLVAGPGSASAPRAIEIRQTDVERATNRLLATAQAVSVTLHPIPGSNRFVVGVQWDESRASVFELDADAPSARRIHDGPGTLAEARLSPDGRHVAFVLAPPFAGRAPPPPRENRIDDERLGRSRPACDPVGSPCGEAGVCGYLPDHCGGHFDCGPCPSDLPPAPGRRHGLFVAPLTAP